MPCAGGGVHVLVFHVEIGESPGGSDVPSPSKTTAVAVSAAAAAAAAVVVVVVCCMDRSKRGGAGHRRWASADGDGLVAVETVSVDG